MIISRFLTLSAIAFSTIAAQDNSELIAKLLEATTDAERTNLLPDEAFKFDFVNSLVGRAVGAGGFSTSADALTMPATIGNDVSISARNLCPLFLPS